MAAQPEPTRPATALTLAELLARAGVVDPLCQPLVVDSRPSARPGWRNVTISLQPGSRIEITVREGIEGTAAMDGILATLPAVYAPAGLRTDPYD